MNRMNFLARPFFGSGVAAHTQLRMARVQAVMSSDYTNRRCDPQAFASSAASASATPSIYGRANPSKSPRSYELPATEFGPVQHALSVSKSWRGAVPDLEMAERLGEFRRFYEMVSKTKELAPTPLGRGGSERILNNSLLHRAPWQASCVELREKPGYNGNQQVLSYDQIDFASLRRRNGGGSPTAGRYAHIDRDAGGTSRAAGAANSAEDRLEVVHYYETSSPTGLAGYQSVAMKVRKGALPGRTENYSSEGGFAVWAVSHSDYVNLLVRQGLIEE